MNERAYMRGQRQVWRILFVQAIRQLGYDERQGTKGFMKWVEEREDALAALRQVCGDHGDNDWPDELNLADVIDKHLGRHLEERTDG